MTACSICEFRYNTDCPLTLLLAGNQQGNDAKNKDTKRGERKESQPNESFHLGAIVERAESNLKEEETQQASTTESSQTSNDTSFPVSACNQCRQIRCQTCKPGYNNFIVDMEDFSKTFGDGVRLCTMCQHWLCPGSELVVIFRCRVCGHDGCESCLGGESAEEKEREGKTEQWYICCICEEEPEVEEVVKTVDENIPIIAEPNP